jgi:hypothetical protein
MISRLQSYDIISKVVSIAYGKHVSMIKKEVITNQPITKNCTLRSMENFGTVLITQAGSKGRVPYSRAFGYAQTSVRLQANNRMPIAEFSEKIFTFYQKVTR